MDKIEKLVAFLIENYPYSRLYDCRNLVGDSLETVYSEDGIVVNNCSNWDYIEIFGLTKEEYKDVVRRLDQSQKKPEEQGELEEKNILRKEIKRIFAEEDVALLLADNLQERLVDFISQLLSERAFTKEELNAILFVLDEYEGGGVGEHTIYVLKRKLSKLLKEKE